MVPTAVVADLISGSSTGLIDNWTGPTKEEIAAFKVAVEGVVAPSALAELDEWLKLKSLEEELSALTGLSDEKITDDIVADLSNGDASRLLATMNNEPVSVPTKESLQKLKDDIPDQAYSQLTAWREQEEAALKEDIAKHTGLKPEEITDDVMRQLLNGDSSGVVDALEASETATLDAKTLTKLKQDVKDKLRPDAFAALEKSIIESALAEFAGVPKTQLSPDAVEQFMAGDPNGVTELLESSPEASKTTKEDINNLETALKSLVDPAAVESLRAWQTKDALKDVISAATNMPKSRIKDETLEALAKGSASSLIAALDSTDVALPTDEQLELLRDAVPEKAFKEIADWVRMEKEAVKKFLADATGLPPDDIDDREIEKLISGDPSVLIASLDIKAKKAPTNDELLKLQGRIPDEALDQLGKWASGAAPFNPDAIKALEELAGNPIPLPVLQAAEKNGTALTNWLAKNGVPEEKKLRKALEKADLPSDLEADLTDWQASKLAPEDIAMLEKALDIKIPPSVIDDVNGGNEDALLNLLLEKSKAKPELGSKLKILQDSPDHGKLPELIKGPLDDFEDLVDLAKLAGKKSHEFPKQVREDLLNDDPASLIDLLADANIKPPLRELERLADPNSGLNSPPLIDAIKATLGPGCLGEWTDWTPCPVTCGRGNRTREKLPKSPHCVETAWEQWFCQLPYCKQGNATMEPICNPFPCLISLPTQTASGATGALGAAAA